LEVGDRADCSVYATAKHAAEEHNGAVIVERAWPPIEEADVLDEGCVVVVRFDQWCEGLDILGAGVVNGEVAPLPSILTFTDLNDRNVYETHDLTLEGIPIHAAEYDKVRGERPVADVVPAAVFNVQVGMYRSDVSDHLY
jgi:hypothetical protein